MPDIGHACVIKYRKLLKIYLFACKFRAAKGCDKLLKTNTTFTIYCNSFEALAANISNRYLIHYKKSIRSLNREPKDYRARSSRIDRTKKISPNHSI